MNYELVELMFRKSLATDKAVSIADELAKKVSQEALQVMYAYNRHAITKAEALEAIDELFVLLDLSFSDKEKPYISLSELEG